MLHLQRILLMFCLLALLAACGGAAGPNDGPVSSEDTPIPAPPDLGGGGEFIIGEMAVESLDILMLESFPVQVHVIARGTLGDGCTSVGEITQRREGDTFFVTVHTQRPADAICTMVLQAGEATIPLEVLGLEAGTYTVDVNGVTDTFELLTDNFAP